ncbi:MAG: ANTAR domain-containing protein [Clostridiales bacterium]
MANEKFIVTTAKNQFQIIIRNLLCPSGYFFLINCNDSISLLRMVRSYNPDFVVIDMDCVDREMIRTIETIDEELLSSIILVGDNPSFDIDNLIEKTFVTSKCSFDIDRVVLSNIIDVSMLSFNRVSILSKKLKDMTDNYETRKLVERAKWILMDQNDISERDAYERMRKKSMNTRISMKQIAEAVIYTNDIKNG